MIKDLLDEHQVLLETLLPSEWTWGCELEFIMGSELYEEITNESYVEYDGPNYYKTNEYMIDIINRYLPNKFDSNDSKMQDDGSLRASDDDVPLEWASPIFEAKPEYFQAIVKFLKQILHEGCYTNDSCGFHHHLMFKGMTERDAVWIYCNLAMDTDFLEKSKQMDEFSFTHSTWSPTSVFREIKDCIEDNNFIDVVNLLNTEKYRYFRIHPQGTLEWRGPRNFLNERDINDIKKFYYKHLPMVINKFIEYNKNNTLYGTNYSKEEFFKKLSEAVKVSDISKRSLGTNEFIHSFNWSGEYKNKNKDYKNPNINTDLLWSKINAKPFILARIAEQNPELLYILFYKMDNHQQVCLRDTLNIIKEQNLSKINYKDFSKIIFEALLKAGNNYDWVIRAFGGLLYMDIDEETYKRIIKEIPYDYFNITAIYLENGGILGLGDIEKYIFNNLDILKNSQLAPEFLGALKRTYGVDKTLNFCWIIMKILYQNGLKVNDNIYSVIRNFVIDNANDSFINKWDKNMISATLNKDINFASFIIYLDPKIYLRLISEKPLIKNKLNAEILGNMPDNVNQISSFLNQ